MIPYVDGDLGEAGEARAVAEASGADERPFHGCYLLQSRNAKYKSKTYIGYTDEPGRRIREHNRELPGGAKHTLRAQPWEMAFVVHGFPSRVSALQFEWAWQNPKRSTMVPEEIKRASASAPGATTLRGRLAVMADMVRAPAFRHLPLTLTFATSEWSAFRGALPPAPPHMVVQVAAVAELCDAKRKKAKAGPGEEASGASGAPSAGGHETAPGPGEPGSVAGEDEVSSGASATQKCADCALAATKLWWSCPDCGARHHLHCLAERALEVEASASGVPYEPSADPGSRPLLPEAASCASCARSEPWPSLLSSLRSTGWGDQSRGKSPRKGRGRSKARAAEATSVASSGAGSDAGAGSGAVSASPSQRHAPRNPPSTGSPSPSSTTASRRTSSPRPPRAPPPVSPPKPRGRPRKETEGPASRGRPKKVLASRNPDDRPEGLPPPPASRGRPKKTPANRDPDDPSEGTPPPPSGGSRPREAGGVAPPHQADGSAGTATSFAAAASPGSSTRTRGAGRAFATARVEPSATGGVALADRKPHARGFAGVVCALPGDARGDAVGDPQGDPPGRAATPSVVDLVSPPRLSEFQGTSALCFRAPRREAAPLERLADAESRTEAWGDEGAPGGAEEQLGRVRGEPGPARPPLAPSHLEDPSGERLPDPLRRGASPEAGRPANGRSPEPIDDRAPADPGEARELGAPAPARDAPMPGPWPGRPLPAAGLAERSPPGHPSPPTVPLPGSVPSLAPLAERLARLREALGGGGGGDGDGGGSLGSRTLPGSPRVGTRSPQVVSLLSDDDD